MTMTVFNTRSKLNGVVNPFDRTYLKSLDEGILGDLAGRAVNFGQRSLGKVFNTKAERDRKFWDTKAEKDSTKALQAQELAKAGDDAEAQDYVKNKYEKTLKDLDTKLQKRKTSALDDRYFIRSRDAASKVGSWLAGDKKSFDARRAALKTPGEVPDSQKKSDEPVKLPTATPETKVDSQKEIMSKQRPVGIQSYRLRSLRSLGSPRPELSSGELRDIAPYGKKDEPVKQTSKSGGVSAIKKGLGQSIKTVAKTNPPRTVTQTATDNPAAPAPQLLAAPKPKRPRRKVLKTPTSTEQNPPMSSGVASPPA